MSRRSSQSVCSRSLASCGKCDGASRFRRRWVNSIVCMQMFALDSDMRCNKLCCSNIIINIGRMLKFSFLPEPGLNATVCEPEIRNPSHKSRQLAGCTLVGSVVPSNKHCLERVKAKQLKSKLCIHCDKWCTHSLVSLATSENNSAQVCVLHRDRSEAARSFLKSLNILRIHY